MLFKVLFLPTLNSSELIISKIVYGNSFYNYNNLMLNRSQSKFCCCYVKIFRTANSDDTFGSLTNKESNYDIA